MSHLLRPSDDEVRMLDIILDLYIEPNKPSIGLKQNRNATFFARELKIDKFKSQSILNEFIHLGDEIGFLKGQQHGYGDWSVVSIDAYKAERFKNNGGFNRYFKSEIDTMTLKEKCNLVLASLFKRTKNDLDIVDDKEIIEDTDLGHSELSSCIKKLHTDGYTGGGKGMTSLQDNGREFWQKGGYKETENVNTTDNLNQTILTFNWTGDNNGNFGVNTGTSDFKQSTRESNEQELELAGKGVKWARIGVIATAALTLAGWVLSYYKIWPFR